MLKFKMIVAASTATSVAAFWADFFRANLCDHVHQFLYVPALSDATLFTLGDTKWGLGGALDASNNCYGTQAWVDEILDPMLIPAQQLEMACNNEACSCYSNLVSLHSSTYPDSIAAAPFVCNMVPGCEWNSAGSSGTCDPCTPGVDCNAYAYNHVTNNPYAGIAGSGQNAAAWQFFMNIGNQRGTMWA